MDEAALKSLIGRYLKLLFGFCLSYAGYSREQAFQIAISSFVHTLRAHSASGNEQELLLALFRQALAECGRVVPAGAAGLESFGEFSAPPQRMLVTVRDALLRLSPGDKAVLLLRDQCHLSYEQTGAVLGTDARQARLACLTARERLRGHVENFLKGKEAGAADAV